MKKLLCGALACALLSGCATVGALTPRKGESPCAFGRRMMDEAQRKVDQARDAAELVCPPIDGVSALEAAAPSIVG